VRQPRIATAPGRVFPIHALERHPFGALELGTRGDAQQQRQQRQQQQQQRQQRQQQQQQRRRRLGGASTGIGGAAAFSAKVRIWFSFFTARAFAADFLPSLAV
jgi:hypothetical protein